MNTKEAEKQIMRAVRIARSRDIEFLPNRGLARRPFFLDGEYVRDYKCGCVIGVLSNAFCNVEPPEEDSGRSHNVEILDAARVKGLAGLTAAQIKAIEAGFEDSKYYLSSNEAVNQRSPWYRLGKKLRGYALRIAKRRGFSVGS